MKKVIRSDEMVVGHRFIPYYISNAIVKQTGLSWDDYLDLTLPDILRVSRDLGHRLKRYKGVGNVRYNRMKKLETLILGPPETEVIEYVLED